MVDGYGERWNDRHPRGGDEGWGDGAWYGTVKPNGIAAERFKDIRMFLSTSAAGGRWRMLARRLDGRGFSTVYASDLSRAKETAQAISRGQ